MDQSNDLGSDNSSDDEDNSNLHQRSAKGNCLEKLKEIQAYFKNPATNRRKNVFSTDSPNKYKIQLRPSIVSRVVKSKKNVISSTPMPTNNAPPSFENTLNISPINVNSSEKSPKSPVIIIISDDSIDYQPKIIKVERVSDDVQHKKSQTASKSQLDSIKSRNSEKGNQITTVADFDGISELEFSDKSKNDLDLKKNKIRKSTKKINATDKSVNKSGKINNVVEKSVNKSTKTNNVVEKLVSTTETNNIEGRLANNRTRRNNVTEKLVVTTETNKIDENLVNKRAKRNNTTEKSVNITETNNIEERSVNTNNIKEMLSNKRTKSVNVTNKSINTIETNNVEERLVNNRTTEDNVEEKSINTKEANNIEENLFHKRTRRNNVAEKSVNTADANDIEEESVNKRTKRNTIAKKSVNTTDTSDIEENSVNKRTRRNNIAEKSDNTTDESDIEDNLVIKKTRRNTIAEKSVNTTGINKIKERLDNNRTTKGNVAEKSVNTTDASDIKENLINKKTRKNNVAEKSVNTTELNNVKERLDNNRTTKGNFAEKSVNTTDVSDIEENSVNKRTRWGNVAEKSVNKSSKTNNIDEKRVNKSTKKKESTNNKKRVELAKRHLSFNEESDNNEKKECSNVEKSVEEKSRNLENITNKLSLRLGKEISNKKINSILGLKLKEQHTQTTSSLKKKSEQNKLEFIMSGSSSISNISDDYHTINDKYINYLYKTLPHDTEIVFDCSDNDDSDDSGDITVQNYDQPWRVDSLSKSQLKMMKNRNSLYRLLNPTPNSEPNVQQLKKPIKYSIKKSMKIKKCINNFDENTDEEDSFSFTTPKKARRSLCKTKKTPIKNNGTINNVNKTVKILLDRIEIDSEVNKENNEIKEMGENIEEIVENVEVEERVENVADIEERIERFLNEANNVEEIEKGAENIEKGVDVVENRLESIKEIIGDNTLTNVRNNEKSPDKSEKLKKNNSINKKRIKSVESDEVDTTVESRRKSKRNASIKDKSANITVEAIIENNEISVQLEENNRNNRKQTKKNNTINNDTEENCNDLLEKSLNSLEKRDKIQKKNVQPKQKKRPVNEVSRLISNLRLSEDLTNGSEFSTSGLRRSNRSRRPPKARYGAGSFLILENKKDLKLYKNCNVTDPHSGKLLNNISNTTKKSNSKSNSVNSSKGTTMTNDSPKNGRNYKKSKKNKKNKNTEDEITNEQITTTIVENNEMPTIMESCMESVENVENLSNNNNSNINNKKKKSNVSKRGISKTYRKDDNNLQEKLTSVLNSSRESKNSSTVSDSNKNFIDCIINNETCKLRWITKSKQIEFETLTDNPDISLARGCENLVEASNSGFIKIMPFGKKTKQTTRKYSLFFTMIQGKAVVGVKDQIQEINGPLAEFMVPKGNEYFIENVDNSELIFYFVRFIPSG